jgi:hypothetical protein
MTLFEVSREIARRLESIFTRDDAGLRPVFGTSISSSDPHWRDHIPFTILPRRQRGRRGRQPPDRLTGAVAGLIQYFGTVTPETALAGRI